MMRTHRSVPHSRWHYRLLVIGILLLTVGLNTARLAAQDTIYQHNDVIQAEYNSRYLAHFVEDGDQVFLQFQAAAGDLVYFTVAETGSGSSHVVLEIRDSVGRSLGVVEDFPTDAFVLAEIPTDGLYTAVVTSDIGIDQTLQMIINRTRYLDETFTPLSFEAAGLFTVFGMQIEDDGLYRIALLRDDREVLPLEVEVYRANGSDLRSIATYRGQDTSQLILGLEMKAGVMYVLRVGSSLSTTTFLNDGANIISEMQVQLKKME